MTADDPLEDSIDLYLRRHEDELEHLREDGHELLAPQGRERDLAVLTSARAAATEGAVQAHEALLAFARDRRVRTALRTVLSDPDAAAAAAADPRAYAQEHGVELPTTLQVTVETYGPRTRVLLVSTDPDTPFVARATLDGLTLFESDATPRTKR